ncbi:haloalkane dehalogenase [Actinoallomurus iriomotensis]|uniref:Haloalkane dehalogenase n=1 Tax=Actinoallomurus iriomotensis TaxID=478107 RepID=A0A9W6RJ89_9ACTN|nr:haloalkane dehalogenase [Actinoallomurus iriomotensis]GLY76708.1 haloalkane dehalogenase [Actinoallomurus iriomotensis]
MPIQRVLDSTIFYRDTGDGAPVVFLHGNPTSSHLWRDVIPAVPGRRLAPDLIGMGESGKPAIGYSFADHARYLDAWFDALALDEVILVGHDWGGALAFDWAARHPERVRGIAVTETIVKPMAWEEFPEAGRALFEAIKSDRGEVMMLDDNAFIEMLPGSVATPLAEDDIAAYRAPYPTRESRLPLLRWARSMPLGGEPADVVARVEAYDAWLAASPDVPKLLITFAPGPGAMMTPEMIDWCERHLAGLEVERYDAVAGHHTPEDRPDLIAAAVVSWRGRHRI